MCTAEADTLHALSASTRASGGPSAEAVAQLQAMFPAASTEQINSALQRGGNDVNRSVEYLL